MNSNTNKTGVLDKALAFLSSKHKKNYKCKIHNKVRDFFIKNLDIVGSGLKFVEKELRVVGGDIDIVAKRGRIFYLIEVKTMLSSSIGSRKEQVKQLLRQRKGLKHIISIFTDKKVIIRLIIVEYVRDTGKVIVKNISNSRIRKFNLKVD